MTCLLRRFDRDSFKMKFWLTEITSLVLFLLIVIVVRQATYSLTKYSSLNPKASDLMVLLPQGTNQKLVLENGIKNNDTPLLCLATSVITKKSKNKTVAQRNTITSLNALPRTRVIVFTDSPSWLQYCKSMGFASSNSYERNNCNTPFFKSMIQILQSTYTCEFYGYVNGDILLSSTIIDVLSNISLFIRKGLLHQRVLITGRRVNGEIPRLSSISSSFSKNDITIELMKKRGTLFREDALDYFVFTSSTYNLSSLLDVVIGRPLYDNYLLHIISNDTEADLVDATESVTAFHQTDEDGIFAGHKPKEDLNWNRKLIKKQFVLGNTNFSDYRIVDGFKLVKHEKPEWSVCSELSRHIRER